MRQLAALAGALALVLVAVAVRGRIDDGDGDGTRELVVVCPTELADACAALGDGAVVRVEDAADTAAAFGGEDPAGDVDADVWLTTRPWSEALADRRARAGLGPLGEPSEVIARSPVVVAVWDDRAAALEDGPCAGTVTWRCLGDAADRPWSEAGGPGSWGRVKVGLTSPESASGLVVLGGAVAGFLDSTDYASNDFGGPLAGWLGALGATPARPGDDPVGRMLTRGPGEYSAVGAIEADTRAATGRGDVRVLYPAPVAVAELVAVPIGGDGGDGDAAEVAGDGALRAALAEQGWRVDGEPAAEGLAADVDLPDGDGLPSGAVLRALLDRWREVTG